MLNLRNRIPSRIFPNICPIADMIIKNWISLNIFLVVVRNLMSIRSIIAAINVKKGLTVFINSLIHHNNLFVAVKKKPHQRSISTYFSVYAGSCCNNL